MGDAVFVSDSTAGPVDLPCGASFESTPSTWGIGNEGAIRYSVHRDQLRKGWWVAPEGVRYVAVEGVPEGQGHAPFGDDEDSEGCCRSAAEQLNEGRVPRTFYGWRRSSERDWAVVDLHDLGPEQAKQARPNPFGHDGPLPGAWKANGADWGAKPSPRYVVLAAEEMRGMEGRRCDRLCEADIRNHPIEFWRKQVEVRGFLGCSRPWRPSEDYWTHAIVDTHDGWLPPGTSACSDWVCQGECGKHTETETWSAIGERLLESVEPPRPEGPSDAEIVAAYELAMRGDAWSGSVDGKGRPWGLHFPGRFVQMAEVRAAWSRELRRRVKASAEQERRRVGCEGDWLEEHEGADA